MSSSLTSDELSFLKTTSEQLGKAQSLLIVTMLVLHEQSQAQDMVTPDGTRITVQGVIDSCAFVSCVVHGILRHIEREWNMTLRPRIVLGYLNYTTPEKDGSQYISVPHLWVETFHERVAELCLKATYSEEKAALERVRITDIAGGITHNREKVIMGRPFHASVTEGAEVIQPVYSRQPLGRVPPMPSGTMEQLQMTEKNPLDALEHCGGRRMKSLYTLVLRKLKQQADKTDIGKYTFNVGSLGDLKALPNGNGQ